MGKIKEKVIEKMNGQDRFGGDSSLELIDNRIAWAEHIACELNKSTSAWFKNYADDYDNNQLIRDFRWMRSKINYLHTKLSDAQYKLESLGESLDD